MKTRRIFKGKIVDLRVERRRLPNGYVGTLEIVRHPGAALVVPVLGDGRVILIRQYRPVIKKYIWELPAGKLDGGERPARCAGRELVEEAGYSAGNIKSAGYIYTAPGYTDEKIWIFRATRLKRVKRATGQDEVISVKPLTRGAIRRLFRKGAIPDAKTVCALTMCGIL